MFRKIKKFIAILLAVILFASLVCFAGCGNIDEDENPTKKTISGSELVAEKSYVKWQGRYEYKTAQGNHENMVALYFTATGFTVDFYGTELTVIFFHQANADGGSNIYYNFALDDEVLPNPAADRTICLPDDEMTTSITLVSGLTKGYHTVTCLKMNEPADAITGVVSFQTDGGFYQRDTAKDNAKTKFMFICASSGSGYGSLVCTSTDKISRKRANSSSLHSFNYLTARMYDADVQYIAQAGWGLCYNRTTAIESIFDYTGILGNSSESTHNNVSGAKTTALWDHYSWVPDVIIFNIGGNDTKKNSFDEATYKTAVVNIVTKLHNLYPNAVMLWTHTNSYAGNCAISALESANILSQGYIKEAIILKVGADGTYGASTHNSFKTHITTAETLAGYLEQYFGLSRERYNINYADFESIITTD